MALSGMTGFARAQASGEYGTVSVEARSVNGKGLDVRLRLPQGFDALEAPLREQAKARFARGSVSVSVTLDAPEAGSSVHLDTDRLYAYAKAARALVDDGLAAPATAGELLALKGVIVSEDAEADELIVEQRNLATLKTVEQALDALRAARRDEGAALKGVLEGHLAEIAQLRDRAAACAGALPDAIRDRLKARLDELVESGLDPDRLAQEAALLAVKADVREELDRLTAHVDSAHALLEAGSPCGRKLDFLSQEFNREANTLCSKSADPALTRIGLDLKAAVDRLREQVQNVE